MTAMAMNLVSSVRKWNHADEAAVPLLLRFLFWATRNSRL